MPLTREQKKKVIEDLKDKLERQKMMVFVGFEKLKTKDLFALRNKLKGVGALFQVSKKTLLDIASKEEKVSFPIEKLVGSLAIVFAFKDEILPAKLVYDFSRTKENLKILGGYFDNVFRSKEDMVELAKLPQREVLLGRLVGQISAPMSGLVYVLQGNLKGLVHILRSIKS